MTHFVLSIEGMTCGHCERAVHEALSQVTGVEKVDVNLSKGEAVVDAQPEVDTAQLIAAVKEEGYKATVES